MSNIDIKVVDGFGDEWSRFDQSKLDDNESRTIFYKYFSEFPWDHISNNSIGFDLGCGSGRWAKIVAPKVGVLHCIDPSSAIEVAKRNLKSFDNCIFHQESVDDMSLLDNSMDFGYSLGVLHHIPNTLNGIQQCVSKLKPGAPFLVYLYYSLDNKPLFYKFIWKCSDLIRRLISSMPHSLRYLASQIIALFVYFPLSRIAKISEKLGFNVKNFPLSFYRNNSIYTLRTDALDRFGTRLEQRFSKEEIKTMMENSGLENIVFRNGEPFWCAVGYKK